MGLSAFYPHDSCAPPVSGCEVRLSDAGQGLTILRFPNDEVLRNVEGVVAAIEQLLIRQGGELTLDLSRRLGGEMIHLASLPALTSNPSAGGARGWQSHFPGSRVLA